MTTAISAQRRTVAPQAPAARATLSSHSLVKQGSRGPQVVELQNRLKAAGFNPGGADGIFGPKTQAALMQYQRAKGLQVDGVAGQQTWGSFHGLSVKPGSSMLGASPARPGGTRGTSHPGGHSHVHDTFEDPKLGPGKQVQAYVNGQPRTITVQPVGNGQYLQADAARNFKAMQAAAARDGINLTATSGFRSMAQQQELYRRYLNGTGNLAARPGYSNHQNGISMDIGGVGGYNTRAYNWLKQNAHKYNFVNDVKGEYWHWTHKK